MFFLCIVQLTFFPCFVMLKKKKLRLSCPAGIFREFFETGHLWYLRKGEIMRYTISQTAEKFHVEPHTLRYYEREGILSPHKTEKGIRYYTEEDLSQLEMVCCLRNTGMPSKISKLIMPLCAQGNETLDQRMEIFTAHRQHILDEINHLQVHLCNIEKKIKWYGTYIESQKKMLTKK